MTPFLLFFNSEIVTEMNFLTHLRCNLYIMKLFIHIFTKNPHFQTALHCWTLSLKKLVPIKLKNWKQKNPQMLFYIVSLPTQSSWLMQESGCFWQLSPHMFCCNDTLQQWTSQFIAYNNLTCVVVVRYHLCFIKIYH